MVLLAGFGWGKPVPVDPYNLRPSGRVGMGIVALAGPLSNLLMAFLFAVPFQAGWITWGMMSGGAVIPALGQILLTTVTLNVYLALFNLLPIAPLDGFNVLLGLLPRTWAGAAYKAQRYGAVTLLALVLLGRMTGLDLLGATIYPVAEAILGLIFG